MSYDKIYQHIYLFMHTILVFALDISIVSVIIIILMKKLD